jgi:hypothetical protein
VLSEGEVIKLGSWKDESRWGWREEERNRRGKAIRKGLLIVDC